MDAIRVFLIAMAAFAAIVAWQRLVSRVVVREFEVALLYRHGRLVRSLGAGLHRVFRPGASWTRLDRRVLVVTVPGQDVLTADTVGLKISLHIAYAIEDPERALHAVASYGEFLYAQAQLALRDLVASMEAEKLLAGRARMNEALLTAVGAAVGTIGLRVDRVEVKDIMLPGDLKGIFASVVRARQEGLAALERTRAETAAMRNLLNAVQLMEAHPGLTTLKWMQTVAEAGGRPGNTFVLGVPPGLLPGREVSR